MFKDHAHEALDRLAFREAMSCLPAAVAVVTTDGSFGPCGITISSLASVTDEPAMVSFCVARRSFANGAIKTNAVVAINLIAEEQSSIAVNFSRRPEANGPVDMFDEAHWTRKSSMPPILNDALLVMTGAVAEMIEVGTHTLFLIEVVSGKINSSLLPSVYFRRSFAGINLEANAS